MTMLASQITSPTVVYSIVYSAVNQRKHQSSASLAFVREIHRGPVNSPHKWPVTRKMFPFDDVIINYPLNGRVDKNLMGISLLTLTPIESFRVFFFWPGGLLECFTLQHFLSYRFEIPHIGQKSQKCNIPQFHICAKKGKLSRDLKNVTPIMLRFGSAYILFILKLHTLTKSCIITQNVKKALNVEV